MIPLSATVGRINFNFTKSTLTLGLQAMVIFPFRFNTVE